MHRSGVRIPLSPPVFDGSAWVAQEKVWHSVKPFSYAALSIRRLFVATSGVRNDVALRYTTLTAENTDGRIPLSPPIFSSVVNAELFYALLTHRALLVRDLPSKYASKSWCFNTRKRAVIRNKRRSYAGLYFIRKKPLQAWIWPKICVSLWKAM